MTTPLLGDPASVSALAGALRRTAVQLAADGERLTGALDDVAPGWSGSRSVQVRRRADVTAVQAVRMAAALDEAGRALQTAATDLAASIAHLRALEEAADAAGLEMRDGTVTKGWGITGVADAGAVHDENHARERLQERVHSAVTTLGRQRSRSAADCAHATQLLREAATALRR